MGLAAFEWQTKQDWNCKILISLRIQFTYIRCHHLLPMPQTLVILSSQYKSVCHVQFPKKQGQEKNQCLLESLSAVQLISKHEECSCGQHILLANEKVVFEQIVQGGQFD